MNDPLAMGAALLPQVQPGLVVYDAANQRLGTVRRVEFGTADPTDERQQAREAIADVRASTTTPADD